MTTTVIFKTDGYLDLSALTTFGMNAKPNTENPIGYFGTGLKYAIAVLVREGIPVSMWIGNRLYEFYVKEVDFRGKGFGQVMMRQKNGLLGKWAYKKLPFTTELGKNWELWQAFRELESNTRDENGYTHSIDSADEPPYPITGKTFIIVESEEFAECYFNMSKTFLPQGLTKRMDGKEVQIFNQPSHHLYYRGLRVYDFEKPSMYTYNILSSMTLTEDRTVKNIYEPLFRIADFIATSDDQQFIGQVVSADTDKFFEGQLDFDYVHLAPSDTFKEVVSKKRDRGGYVMPRVTTYHDRYTPQPPEDETQKLWYKLNKVQDLIEPDESASEEEILEGREVLKEAVEYLKDRSI